MKEAIFKDLIGKNVKAPFRDGRFIKVARGRLEGIEGGFIRVRGERGLILINQANVEKITCLEP